MKAINHILNHKNHKILFAKKMSRLDTLVIGGSVKSLAVPFTKEKHAFLPDNDIFCAPNISDSDLQARS